MTQAIGEMRGPVVVGVGDSAGRHTVDMAGLWVEHRARLVRLAVVLLDDVGQAEDVVQEAFIKACAKPRALRDPSAALAYLRQTVVNLCRSSLRRRVLAARRDSTLQSRHHVASASATDDASTLVERDAILRAVRALPRRHREAVTLRYYLDLTEAQAAAVMGVGIGSVKSYTSRGLDQLARALEGAR